MNRLVRRFELYLRNGCTRREGFLNAFLLVLGLVVLVICSVVQMKATKSPVLFPEGGARWIRMDEPTLLSGRHLQRQATAFRKRFELGQPQIGAVLSFRAMKQAWVILDGKLVFEDTPGNPGWNFTRSISLPALEGGRFHELLFLVQSLDSHPAILVYSESLGLHTGLDWEVTTGNRVWVSAMLAEAPHPPEIMASFPSTFSALWKSTPILLPLFLLAAGFTWVRTRKEILVLKASSVRWAVLVAFSAMALNNVGKLPLPLGMDSAGHLEYIRHLANGKGLPLAGQGWQMFQAPLYYLVSAPLFHFAQTFGGEFAQRTLRLVPWFCGIAQVELCYRALRAVNPDKDNLQIVGLLLSALIPMNVYMSQTIGNESLSAAFSSLALVMVLVRTRKGNALATPTFGLLLGLVLGLALLTKTSNFIMALILPSYCLAWGTEGSSKALSHRIRTGMPFLATYAGTLFLVAGWYYLRNCWYLGVPFVGGWDPKNGTPWWQDHGYIPISFLFRFGRVLLYPIYGQTLGFLSGLYSTFWTDGSICSVVHPQFIPPWNFNFLLGGVLLSLTPFTLMVTGAFRTFGERATRLSLTCILAYIAAIFYLHISTLPAYSTLKSTYMLGLLPCFGILGSAGFETLATKPITRSLVAGLIASWAVSTYFGFWIL